MPHNRPLRLKLASKKDFATAIRVLYGLIAVAVVLSPQPVVLTLSLLLFFGMAWIGRILGLYNVPNTNMTLIIFPDGHVRLKSDCEDKIEGFLVGQQWCINRLAVLRINNGGTIKKLLILSAQQHSQDDYRRLNMWLRQDFAPVKQV